MVTHGTLFNVEDQNHFTKMVRRFSITNNEGANNCVAELTGNVNVFSIENKLSVPIDVGNLAVPFDIENEEPFASKSDTTLPNLAWETCFDEKFTYT